MSARDSRTEDKFPVRFPTGMRDRVSVLSTAQRRSMNSYMVQAVEAALERDEKENGTSVEPETVQGVVMETRPQFVVGMACRYNGNPAIIREMQFHESGEFIEARIDIGEFPAYVPLEDLEAY